MKKGLLFLHKWLGIFSGLIFMVLSLTGAIFVFNEEINVLLKPEKYFIQPDTNLVSNHLPINRLLELAQNAIPKKEEISRIEIYPDKHRTWVFRAQKTDKSAIGYNKYILYYKKVYINPYTGKIHQVENTKNDFFQMVIQLHMNLLLGKKIGQPIIIMSVICFMLISLSGIYLWWPKKWKRKKIAKHFKIEWKKNWKWKRKNYDIHRVLGFYSCLFILLFSITGLVFASPIFKEKYISFFNYISKDTITNKKNFPLVQQEFNNTFDNTLAYVLKAHPNADKISVRLRDENEKNIDFQVRIEKNKSNVFYWYYFDKTNGQISNIKSYNNQKLGDRMDSLNYDLHTGSLGGVYTKIIYVLICIICFLLPVTGFIIYWNKKR